MLNVELPLVGFYVVVPWLVLIFHAHLLNQFFLLSRKLFHLNRALKSLPPQLERLQRELPFPLVFSHLIIGTHHSRLIRGAFGVAVIFIILLTPIALLLAIQYKFLPYHSEGITFNHQLVFTLDLLLLWIFWPRLFSPSGRWRDWWSRSGRRWRILVSIILGVLASTILLFGSWTLLVPHVGGIEEWLAERERGWSCIYGNPEREQGLFCIHRDLELRERTLMRKAPPVELLSAARGNIKAEVSGDTEAEAKVWIKDGEALDLRGRDLRYADFYQSKLWNADLRGAKLQHATLLETNLQGARLRQAQLQDAGLIGAQLQGADLRQAAVYGTRFRDTELSFADLRDLCSLPVGWQRAGGRVWEPFSGIEWLEGVLKKKGEHWSENERIQVAQAIDRFWSSAFDLPLEPTAISPLQGFDVMYDQEGLFAAWPAPPDEAEFEQARAEYRTKLAAELACDDQYIAKGMWRRAKKTEQYKGDPVLEQALREKAASRDCPVLAEVISGE